MAAKCIWYAQGIVPSFLKRSTDKSTGETHHDCKLSTQPHDWGLCKIKTIFLDSPSSKSSIDVQIQVGTNNKCNCNLQEKVARGLSKRAFTTINTLVLTHPDLKPDQAQLKIIQNELNSKYDDGTMFPVTTNKERLESGMQIKNDIDYQKRCTRQ